MSKRDIKKLKFITEREIPYPYHKISPLERKATDEYIAKHNAHHGKRSGGDREKA